ncbi:MAG: methionyl-tRNA formyltransferase [Oscillospiraceae bacterium]|nr:methionyl-tRNA formyltransferase [Oscillospiraceae bacterium]
MGTPDFSVPALAALKAAGHEICAVFAKPDKPKNRGKQIQTCPVKDFAIENDFEIFQPNSLKKGDSAAESLSILHKINPDVIVVIAYGQILPNEILELPKFGCINVHASLLPKYRGAAPIQRCIQDGETKSGVCTMRIDSGIDTGDVIMRREVEIPPEMTGSELWETLSQCGAELIVETLSALENGTAEFTPQPSSEQVSYAKMISKEELRLDFTKPAKQLYDFIRAMADTPCAYTMLEGKRLKIYRARLTERTSTLPAGSITDTAAFSVVCGDGICIELSEVQIEGGKRMKSDDFLRGKKLEKGLILG